AKVQIQNPPSYNISSATDLTDGLGQYGVGVAVAGTYTVTVSKQAYVSQTFTVSVSSGNVTTLNVYLCTQSPAFAYTGQVFDNSSSNGIQGVHVHLQDSTIVWDTITNASGNFTIPAMLTGTYDILVGEWGYITKCFSGQAINATASTFSVGLDHGYYDDFSLDYGWTVSGACANKWERCVPVGTYDANNGNAVANPAVDVSNDCSNQCYVTDNGGGAAYDHDVDPPGYTILTSPIFDVSSYTNAYVSYYRWFYDAMLNGNAPNDTMSIFISNGTNTVLMERMVKNTAGNGTWAHKSFQVSGFVTPSATMQIILQISDAMPGSVVEGGLDKFFVFDSTNNAVNEVSTSVKVSVYPNPFTEKTTLLITNGRVLDPTLKVYNMFGEEVAAEVAVIPSGFTIQRGSLPKGIYFYKIISGKENLATGKLVVD
ncbi:MAG TPA: carboxypeptidase regulatory-like domain-containing protein, partial [Bacteroidia bacterium]